MDKNNKDENVVNLSEKMRKIAEAQERRKEELKEDTSLETLYNEAIEVVKAQLDESQSFIAIVFDQEGQPSIIHAGELDIIKVLGTLEFTKHEFTQGINQYMEPTLDFFEDFDFED